MIRGTIKSLVGKVEFNGEVLNEAQLRALATLGANSFFKAIGTLPSGGKRGRPEIVYNVNNSIRAKFGVVEGETVEDISEVCMYANAEA